MLESHRTPEVALVTACGTPADQRAYEQVIATMSMQKAAEFFKRFPRSGNRDSLVEEIVGCREDDTPECYRLVMATIPKEHARYRDVVAQYERRFGDVRGHDRGKEGRR